MFHKALWMQLDATSVQNFKVLSLMTVHWLKKEQARLAMNFSNEILSFLLLYAQPNDIFGILKQS